MCLRMSTWVDIYEEVVIRCSLFFLNPLLALVWVERKLSKTWNHKLQCTKIVLGKEPVSVFMILCPDATKDK